jgi:hypothetical protein
MDVFVRRPFLLSVITILMSLFVLWHLFAHQQSRAFFAT